MVADASDRLEDLAAIEAAVWRQLAAAVNDKSHAWRIGVLATRAGEGADARSIVLREWAGPTRTLSFFVDSRSAKAAQIEACPEGVIVLWSPALSWQLRLNVTLQVAGSGLAVSSRWARLKMSPAAQDYLSPLPPGSTLAAPEPAARPERSSREHFAVVSAAVRRVDWLELHARGHRRAIWDEQGWRWVVP